MHTKHFLLIVFILFSSIIHAEWKPAIIKDKDGYTNIRKEAKLTSEIVTIVKDGEIFYCNYSSNEEWIAVMFETITDKSFKQRKGYIHKSRISLLENLNIIKQKQIISKAFYQQRDYALAFHKNISSQKLRRKVEINHETLYLPTLDLLPIYYCKTNDVEIIKLFFSVLWADRASASEAPSWALGKCFVCSPKVISREIKNIKNIEKRISILYDLEFGLNNLGYINKNGKCNYPQYLKLAKELSD